VVEDHGGEGLRGCGSVGDDGDATESEQKQNENENKKETEGRKTEETRRHLC